MQISTIAYLRLQVLRGVPPTLCSVSQQLSFSSLLHLYSESIDFQVHSLMLEDSPIILLTFDVCPLSIKRMIRV